MMRMSLKREGNHLSEFKKRLWLKLKSKKLRCLMRKRNGKEKDKNQRRGAEKDVNKMKSSIKKDLEMKKSLCSNVNRPKKKDSIRLKNYVYRL